MSDTRTRQHDRRLVVASAGQRQVPTLELAGIAGLATMIAIHATELAGKVEEVAYLGFGYVALIAGAFVAALMLAVGDRRGWVVAAATASATLVGYVLTRTTGLPGSTDDIGNWGETLAIWSMLAELGVCGLAAVALGRPRRV